MKPYSTENLYADTEVFAREIFQITEWIIVLVAVSYSAERTENIWLVVLGWLLYLLLGLYIVIKVMRFVWWIDPTVGPNKPRTIRTMTAAALSLAAVIGMNQLTQSIVEGLLDLQRQQQLSDTSSNCHAFPTSARKKP